MSAASRLHVLGALALELAPGSAAVRDMLSQAEASTLVELLARDLAAFAPEVARLELVLVGAHYDPVELLRPGWPLHRQLEQLAARAPRNKLPLPLAGRWRTARAPLARVRRSARAAGAGRGAERDWGEGSSRMIAFGSHDGQLPEALEPSPDHRGGALRLLPWLLGGDADVVSSVGDMFERELLERGMAGAATALAAQEAFGLQIEHARYLTLHDLTAMTAMQYQHAGLAPLWPLLETALLAPASEEWLDAPPEPLLHYADGQVRIALLSPQAWQARYAADALLHDGNDGDDARESLQRRHQQFEARQRQFAAVLGAHGVPVTFVHCHRDADDRVELS